MAPLISIVVWLSKPREEMPFLFLLTCQTGRGHLNEKHLKITDHVSIFCTLTESSPVLSTWGFVMQETTPILIVLCKRMFCRNCRMCIVMSFSYLSIYISLYIPWCACDIQKSLFQEEALNGTIRAFGMGKPFQTIGVCLVLMCGVDDPEIGCLNVTKLEYHIHVLHI